MNDNETDIEQIQQTVDAAIEQGRAMMQERLSESEQLTVDDAKK